MIRLRTNFSGNVSISLEQVRMKVMMHQRSWLRFTAHASGTSTLAKVALAAEISDANSVLMASDAAYDEQF